MTNPNAEARLKFARNLKKGPLVLAKDSQGMQRIVWEGAGNPNGEDVQAIEPAVQALPDYHKLLMLNIIEEVEDPAMAYQIEQAARLRYAAQEKARAETDPTVLVQPAANNDYVTLNCLGPAGHSGGQCGHPVPVKSYAVNEEAPLCAKHAYLKPQFIAEDGDIIGDDGKPQIVWKRMTISTKE